jgi:fibronectin type 3 domain-containing protein
MSQFSVVNRVTVLIKMLLLVPFFVLNLYAFDYVVLEPSLDIDQLQPVDPGVLQPVCTADALPSKPTSVQASAQSFEDKIVVSSYWSLCATSYDIYRASVAGGPKTKLVDNTVLLSYTDTGLEAGKMYFYFVKANNDNGTSDFSDVAIGGTAAADAPPPPLSKPTNVKASDGTYEDKIVISWDVVVGADSYTVFRNTVGVSQQFMSINWPGTAGTSFQDTNVEVGVTYYYLVTAYRGNEKSDPSAMVIGRVSDVAEEVTDIPEVPASLSASDGTKVDQVDITVTEVTGATKYEIYRSSSAEDMGTKLGTSASHLIADTTVTPGTYYYYRAKACNSAGCSDYTMPDRGYAGSMEEEAALSIEATVANTLIGQGSYIINGTFGHHDFAGVDAAFDWAYTVMGGGSYQLQGNPAREDDVFGWKPVSIPTPTAAWYMFPLGGDIDGDGVLKFDWILVYTNMNDKQVYKLNGVNASGNFEYSNKIPVNYAVSGNSITFTAP